MDDVGAGARRKVLAYCGALIVLVGFADPHGGLIGLPISFLLKNKLHLSAQALAGFRLWTSLPLFGAALFGLARDRTSPFGRGDRGQLIVFGAAAAALYGGFAFMPVSYTVLLIGVLLITVSMQMLWSAQAGLAAVLSRRQQMSGQMSATWSLVLVIPGVVSLLLGGALSDLLEKGAAETAARTFLLAGAALSAGIALFGVFKPATIFPSSAEPEPARGSLLTDVARLIRYKPIYPALLAYLLWVFTPGTGTPLQYYLTNTLHGSDSQWGQFLAILNLSMIPTFLLFGWLARRVALRRLLWWSVIVGAPGLIPMLFVHSAAGALALAVLFGLSCGLGNAAFLNLMIRVCPQGLEGTMMMMAACMVAIAARGGDVLGAAIYDRWHSFTPCVVAATLTTGAILLVLPFLSKDLVSETDGQAVPDSLAEPVAAPA